MRTIALLLLLLLGLRGIAQQPGDLDTSFAVGGKLILEEYGPVRDVVVQADGKIVVLTSDPFFHWSEQSYSDPPLPHYLIRLHANGSVDMEFGIDGRVEFNWKVRRLLCRSDDKLIGVGQRITRLLPDGATDSTYSENGELQVLFNGYSTNWIDAALYPNNDLIVGGGRLLCKIDASGAIDTLFGGINTELGFVHYATITSSPNPTTGSTTSTSRLVLSLVVVPSGGIVLHLSSAYSGGPPASWSTYTIHRISLDFFGEPIGSVSLSGCQSGNYCPSSKGLAVNSSGCVFSYVNKHLPASAIFHISGTCGEADTGLANALWPYAPAQYQPWPESFPGGTRPFALADEGFILPQRLTVGSGIAGFATMKFKPNSLELDSTWGYHGFLHTEVLGSTDEGARSFAQQTDGKFLLGGHVRTSTWKFVLVRYLNEYGPACKVDLKMKLGGASATGAELMRDDLRAQGLLPLEQPYSPPAYSPVNGVGDDSIDASLLLVEGDSAIVDWVWLELLDPTDPTEVLATRVGLLQRNGRVTQADGSKPIDFEIGSGSYLLRVKHRNHLSVSLQPVQLGMFPPHVDLTDPSTPTFGTDAQKEVDGIMMLWPGDVNGNGNVMYVGSGNDRDPILISIGGSIPTATTTGYLLEDVNMDGVVKYVGAANDRDIILQTIGGTVPTAVRVEQGP